MILWKWKLMLGLGRTIPRRRITSRLGKFRHRTLHRIISRWSCLVLLSFPPIRSSPLIDFQGNLHNRLLDYWRWCPRPSDPNKESHLHHLLRSRRHLRRHHVDCLLVENQLCGGGCVVLGEQLLHWLCPVLGRSDGWVV